MYCKKLTKQELLDAGFTDVKYIDGQWRVFRHWRKNNSKNKDFVTIYDICDDLYKGCYHMNHARERRKIYSEQKFPYEIKHLKL